MKQKSLTRHFVEIAFAYALISLVAIVASYFVGASMATAGVTVMAHFITNAVLTSWHVKVKQPWSYLIAIIVFVIAVSFLK